MTKKQPNKNELYQIAKVHVTFFSPPIQSTTKLNKQNIYYCIYLMLVDFIQGRAA